MAKRERDYKHEYAIYQGKPDQIKKRSQRNKARRMMQKAGLVGIGDGKDVAHKKAIDNGGTNSRSNLTVQSPSKNRGWRKGKKGYSV